MVYCSSPMFCLFYDFAWVRTFPHLNWITRFGLAPFTSAVATQRIFDWGGGVWFVISYEYNNGRKMYWLCLFWLQVYCIVYSIFFLSKMNKIKAIIPIEKLPMEKFIFQVKNLQPYKNWNWYSCIIPMIQEFLQNVDFSYLWSKLLQQF